MLTTSKVLAGGLAAATTAVLGSYLGVLGTVGGAAVGSVASALTAEIYQRSIDHTADKVRAHTNRGGPRTPPSAEPTQEPTGGLSVGSLLLGSFLIFMLAIGAVTWTEYLTGEPLSGGDKHSTTISDLAHLNVGSAVGDLLGGSGGSSKHGLLGGLLG